MKQKEFRTNKKHQSSSLPTRSRGVGIVRIVGGKFKRTPLLVGDRDGLRPTSERVRETVFDWLTHLKGPWERLSVCDMFAGSGAMGLEAASRGARRVVSVEKDRKTATGIAATVEKLHAEECVEVVRGDVFAYLAGSQEKFDVMFIDPPFAKNLQMRALEVALDHLTPTGLVYLEGEQPFEQGVLHSAKVRIVRSAKAGAVHYLLVSPQQNTDLVEG